MIRFQKYNSIFINCVFHNYFHCVEKQKVTQKSKQPLQPTQQVLLVIPLNIVICLFFLIAINITFIISVVWYKENK